MREDGSSMYASKKRRVVGMARWIKDEEEGGGSWSREREDGEDKGRGRL